MKFRDEEDVEEERTVDAHAGVTNDLLDLAVSLKVVESLAGKAAVDLETIDKGGDSDQTVGLDILLELVVGGLVENDGVLGLVLDCRAKDMLVNVASRCSISYPQLIQRFLSCLVGTRRKSSRSHGWW